MFINQYQVYNTVKHKLSIQSGSTVIIEWEFVSTKHNNFHVTVAQKVNIGLRFKLEGLELETQTFMAVVSVLKY